MTILYLNEISKDDLPVVGGKGANLGELIKEGFPVPQGFVVTAQQYRDFIGDKHLPTNLTELKRFREILVATPLPADLAQDIRKGDENLRDEANTDLLYAVRSSATAEDLADASFAGQHETYYYVSPNDLEVMIRKCWASLWSDMAYSYRESKGINHHDVDMAVVVQRMLKSRTSGVTFTADPVSGSRSVVITESTWGMGAAIVDGRVSPDQFVVSKEHRNLTAIRIADKKFMVPASPPEPGESRLQPVLQSMRRQESLSDEEVDEITGWALKSEEHFGTPQDLEWSYEDEEFYLLQSRPITAIGQEQDEVPEGRYVLFKPMAENFTDPLLPLSQDIFMRLFPILKLIYGRPYLDFNHIKWILPFKMKDADIVKAAYLSDVEFPRVSLLRLIPFLVILYVNYLLMGVIYRRTASMPNDFMESFRAKFKRVVANPAYNAVDALRELMMTTPFFEPVGNMVLMVNVTAGRYFIIMEVLSTLLKRWLPDLREDAASFLCSGDPDILSTDMGRKIWGLARIARGIPEAREIILNPDAAQALSQLKSSPECELFMEQLDAFLAMHGHRTLKEFEINSVRWEENPSPVISMIRNYLLSDSDADALEQKVIDERIALEQEIERGLNSKWRMRLVRYLSSQAKYFIRLRENSRFYHIMGFYAVRKKIIETEALLLDAGRLKCKDDVFFLNWAELNALSDGRIDWPDIEDVIRARRMDYIRLGKLTPPKAIGIELDEPAAPEGGDTLGGQGASPGTYEGIARVIMDPGISAEIYPGEILVAPFTDPAWTPLFLTAHAAVVEVGSYLSHAGTIAREFGMPCVVDVAGCTRMIKSGDRVRVDGSGGRVELLERKDD
jgi:pyruvate,water dikinase